MYSKLSFFVIVVVCFVLIALPNKAMGQQHVMVVNKQNEPVEDAIIAYYPITLKSFQKVAITNANGSAKIDAQAQIIIHISKLGFITISDTLEANQSKKYTFLPSNVNLNDVVVTGQFEAGSVEKSVHKMRIIDRNRIEAQGAVNLKDLLSNELNIRISQDAVLGSQISMMGLGGQNVKILVDGVPVIGRMDGNIDISQININNIERIEIIEGPMSVIYGTDALGGVINLITKKPDSKQYRLNINTYHESVGTYNVDGNFGYRHKAFQFSASAGRNYFDGYSTTENDEIRWKQWKPREQYFADAQLRFKIKNQSHRYFSQYFNETIVSKSNPLVTPYSVKGFDDYFVTNRTNNALYSDFYLHNKASINLINSLATFSRTKNSYNKNLVTGEKNITTNPEDHDTTKFNLITLRGTYTTKTQNIYNSQLGYDINLENGEGKRLKNNTQHIGDYAMFFISDIKATSRLTIRQGLRFIYNTRYGAPVVPSLNIKYDLLSNLAVRASYAQGFRAPSLKELSLFFVDVNHNIQGNENLRAETSNNYSTSITYSRPYKKQHYKIETTLFYNSVNDLISLAIVNPTAQLYNYINVDHYKTKGINLSTDVQLNNFKLSVGYSCIGRYNQLSDSTTVEAFSYANEYRLTMGYTLPKPKIEFNLFYKYTGRLPGYGIDENNNVYQTFVDDYSFMDGSVSKAFFKNRIKLTAGVKNILNVGNIMFNTTASAHSSSSGSMPIAMGRFYFTSIRINLEKN